MQSWTPPRATEGSSGGSDQQQQQLWATAPNSHLDCSAPSSPQASWSPHAQQQAQLDAATQPPAPPPAASKSGRFSFNKAKVAPEPGQADGAAPFHKAHAVEVSRPHGKVPLICCVLPCVCFGVACVRYDGSAEEADEKVAMAKSDPAVEDQPPPATSPTRRSQQQQQQQLPQSQQASSAMGEQTQQTVPPTFPPLRSSLPPLHQQRFSPPSDNHDLTQQQLLGFTSSPAANLPGAEPPHGNGNGSSEFPKALSPASTRPTFPTPGRLPPISSLPPISIRH